MSDQASGLLSPLLRACRFHAVRPYLHGRVLDFGCGVGWLAQCVASDLYTGVDSDEESLSAARSRFPRHTFLSVAEFAGTPDRFDTTVALAVVEHMPSVAAFLSDLRARLRPRGRVVLTTPSPGLQGLYWLGARVGVFSRVAAAEHRQLLGRRDLEGL
ncbi:methyltransferase domain-containing protein, partial [candidate division WOR-3 bacterium]|nr:methyltransferase domain-containing protein [candidate division WOR-3 bacterium]